MMQQQKRDAAEANAIAAATNSWSQPIKTDTAKKCHNSSSSDATKGRRSESNAIAAAAADATTKAMQPKQITALGPQPDQTQ
jgi:regulator of extracellular matrix RemA (YlzA/DUF370 family)